MLPSPSSPGTCGAPAHTTRGCPPACSTTAGRIDASPAAWCFGGRVGWGWHSGRVGAERETNAKTPRAGARVRPAHLLADPVHINNLHLLQVHLRPDNGGIGVVLDLRLGQHHLHGNAVWSGRRCGSASCAEPGRARPAAKHTCAEHAEHTCGKYRPLAACGRSPP